MAKKSSKPNIPQATLERARRELYSDTTPVEVHTSSVAGEAHAAAAPKRAVRVKREVNLREEYAYVAQDLRNMAILAATLMALLIVLALSGVV